MKILVDGSPLIGQKTGIGYYTYHLLEAISELDKKNQYKIFAFDFLLKKPGNPKLSMDFEKQTNFSNSLVRIMPTKIYSLLYKKGFKIPIDLLLGLPKYDLVLNTHFRTWPLIKKKPQLTVIYDLAFLHYPEFASPKNLTYLKKVVPEAIKHSQRIITISEYTKKDIHQLYGYPLNKIDVAYPAIDHQKFMSADKTSIQQVKQKYQLSSNYILYSGTLEPRKNIINLVKAYISLDNQLKSKYQLVLAGKMGWLSDELEILLAKYKHENIKLTGYVTDSDQAALYSGADLFVYVPFFEGFGMPPLEAQACGTLTLCTNNSSLPESAGKNSLYTKSTDSHDIAIGIKEALGLSNKTKNDLINQGFKNAKSFNWQNSAKIVINSINQSH